MTVATFSAPLANITHDDHLAIQPQVAMDGSGNAAVLWVHIIDYFEARVYARAYLNGDWDDAVAIDRGNTRAVSPRIAMNTAGDAIAVWLERPASDWKVVTKHFTRAGGWNPTAEDLLGSSEASSEASEPFVAIDSLGNGVAFWRHGVAITGRSYAVGRGWGQGRLIAPHQNAATPRATFEARFPRLTTGPGGHALMIWLQSTTQTPGPRVGNDLAGGGGPVELLALRVDPGTSLAAHHPVTVAWDTATMLSSAALDEQGNATIAWTNPFSEGVYSRRLANDGVLMPNLAAPPLRLDSLTQEASLVSTGVGSAGDGMTVWLQSDGTAASVFWNRSRYAPETNRCRERWEWERAHILENSNEQAFAPMVAVYPGGSAIALWAMGTRDRATSIYAAVYSSSLRRGVRTP